MMNYSLNNKDIKKVNVTLINGMILVINIKKNKVIYLIKIININIFELIKIINKEILFLKILLQ